MTREAIDQSSPHTKPQIFGADRPLSKEVSFIAQAIVEGNVVALRIAKQPPYGLMLRVDDINLLQKVWIAKGRVDSSGRADFNHKPVTSLSIKQIDTYVDLDKLSEFGYSREIVDKVLDLGMHTVLPVNDKVPKHLITESEYGNTISVMRFDRNGPFFKLVEDAVSIDPHVIVGGTSLNRTGNAAYTDTVKMLQEMGGPDSFVDIFMTSSLPPNTDLNNGLFHPIISLMPGKVAVLREGIGYTELKESIASLNLKMEEKHK